jgi:hypothetical protein
LSGFPLLTLAPSPAVPEKESVGHNWVVRSNVWGIDDEAKL